MRFEVETNYDLKTMKAFKRLVNKTVHARRIKIVRIISIVIGCFGLVYSLLWLMVAQWVPALMGLVIGIVFLLVGIKFESYLLRDSKHDVSVDIRTIRYIFDKNGYLTDNQGKTNYSSYRIVQNVCEDEGYFALMLGRKQGFILDKAHFLVGTPEAFASFIVEKIGKPILHA